MSVTLKPKSREREDKPTISLTAKTKLSKFAADIDALGAMLPKVEKALDKIKALGEEIKPYKEKLKEVQLGLTALHEIAKTDPDMKDIKELGEKFMAVLGAQGKEREISDMDKVFEFLGDENFFKLATVKLGDIDQYLTPEERDKCLKTTRVERSIKIIPRPKTL